jgi:tetratricopeptide (TPR) repeat protein
MRGSRRSGAVGRVLLVLLLGWASAVFAQAPAAPSAAAAGPEPAPSAADPPPEVQAQYRDVVERAVIEYDAGRWAEARALFLRAHELWPSARTLRTLGMTSFELRAYAQALQELQGALDDARRPLPEDQRAQVVALIDQARAFVGRYRVQVSPPEAEVLVDGAPHALGADGMLLLEVGRHELRARAPGHAELTRRLDVRGREDEAIALQLSAEGAQAAPAPAAAFAPPASSAPATTDAAVVEPEGGDLLFTWIAAGTTVALAGTSLALWLVSDNKYDQQLEECRDMSGMGCVPGTIDTAPIQDLETAHLVTAVLAGVAGAATVTLYFVESGDTETASVSIGPTGISARGRF